MKTIDKIKKLPGIRWALSVRNETLLIIIAVMGFLNLAGWMRKWDPTAAPMDLGILSIIAVGIVGIVAGVLLFWVLWRICFPKDIDLWFDRSVMDANNTGKPSFLSDFLKAPPAVRLLCFFGTFWAVLLSLGLIAMSLR